MDLATVELVLEVLERRDIQTLDLTGGAPEMNPHFRFLVTEAAKRGIQVIDRCNLSILLEPGYRDLPQFFVENQVTVVASLPCYTEKNVSQQRGKGVFQQSIEALKRLNQVGYGVDDRLALNLVYNPNGAFLPPDQQQLELEYKERLYSDFGLVFNQLFTITNMPISRFGAVLLAKGEYQDYMQLLKNNFYPDNLDSLMCKSTVSVDWQGHLYDCDFNQMLGLPYHRVNTKSLIASDRSSNRDAHLRDLLVDNVGGQSIAIGDHCYGCTAGQGSSCGGALEGA
jgi:radical SAM/Cys-rich protein